MDQARFGTEEVEHGIGDVVAGPMVRIVDLTRALESRGYAAEGVLELASGDGPTHRLEAKDGRAHASAHAGEPAVRFRGNALAAVLYGALSPSSAARLGWAAGPADALREADALLALPPYFALDAF
jgi:predicted acetyltransferase